MTADELADKIEHEWYSRPLSRYPSTDTGAELLILMEEFDGYVRRRN